MNETELRQAIENNEFVLHYQPKVHFQTGKIIGMEALIRWEHPELGMVPPGKFIPLAEETGLINSIGKWVLREACRQNQAWQENCLPPMVVSVNISPRQFKQAEFIKNVSELLLETGLDPHYLELEITESMTADSEQCIRTLQKLKDIGVTISIDDFGKGFSSLHYLKQLPVDTLKIDKAFIRDLHKNPMDETIVKTIISLAHNLKLDVVAEGIETKEQLLFLQQHLCDKAQGYFFSRPLPAEDFEKKFSEIQKVIHDYGISQKDHEQILQEEAHRVARQELLDMIRQQHGMTFKYRKINGRFIHTFCDGELLYKLGLVPEVVVGKELKEFLPLETAVRKDAYYRKAWNGEENVSYEEEINGIYYLSTLRPVKRSGQVTEVIASCIDITEKRKAAELVWKHEKLSLAGELAAGMAHEIRNPLTSIKGFMQMVRQGDGKSEYFDIIEREFFQLDEIIKGFISLSKPEAVEQKEANIKELLQKAITLLASETALHNVQIEFQVSDGLPPVRCEESKMTQVFVHIIKNSIDAMAEGGFVKIFAYREKSTIVIEVVDNGKGIHPERLQKLGEPFYCNRERGIGMGLMFSYRTLQEHNGAISINSQVNKGTTVEVRIPIIPRS